MRGLKVLPPHGAWVTEATFGNSDGPQRRLSSRLEPSSHEFRLAVAKHLDVEKSGRRRGRMRMRGIE